MENKFLKLTNTVYKVLEFFPESDPLKNRAKDRALAIMERLVLVNETSGWASFQKEKIKAQLSEDIDVLLGYLWMGKTQGWLNSVNCLIIANEYEKIKEDIRPIIELTSIAANPVLNNMTKTIKKATLVPKDTGNLELSERQRKIIDFLKEKGQGQVMDLQTVLSDVTKRTIRRDIDELINGGKIIRLGDFNKVFYKIA
jgi:hypothetical protein